MNSNSWNRNSSSHCSKLKQPVEFAAVSRSSKYYAAETILSHLEHKSVAKCSRSSYVGSRYTVFAPVSHLNLIPHANCGGAGTVIDTYTVWSRSKLFSRVR